LTGTDHYLIVAKGLGESSNSWSRDVQVWHGEIWSQEERSVK